MNSTLLIWACVFSALAIMSLRRPVWAVSLYLLTFFASPPFWWWGKAIESYRWSLYGGLALLMSVLLSSQRSTVFRDTHIGQRLRTVVLLMAANATLVHFFLAENMRISSTSYILFMKLGFLFLLIPVAVHSHRDLRIVVLALTLGAAYIGYEATINSRGGFVRGRLEGIGAPGHASANDLAVLMVALMPLSGVLLLVGRRWEKCLSLAATPLILNTILMCNSRGAFLAAILSAFAFLAAAPRSIRKKAATLLGLGAIVAFLLLGDPKIVERFVTTFAAAEDRDRSAASRLDFWQAGLQMIADHPLGAGGDGFKRAHGPAYIRQVTGIDIPVRSVHQGYINEACEWGVQGLLLRVAFYSLGIIALWRGNALAAHCGDTSAALVGSAIASGVAGILLAGMFGTVFGTEVGYWLVALSLVHYQLQVNSSITTQSLCAMGPRPTFAPARNGGHLGGYGQQN